MLTNGYFEQFQEELAENLLNVISQTVSIYKNENEL